MGVVREIPDRHRGFLGGKSKGGMSAWGIECIHGRLSFGGQKSRACAIRWGNGRAWVV
jgi:hypothetical protein